jgi:plastocyanin
MISRAASLVALLMLFPLAPPVHAGGSVVTVTDNRFVEDVTFLPRPGYAVPWQWDVGLSSAHNVRQDKGLFRSGDPTSVGGTMFERVFSAGTFHYYCEVHGSPSGGMDGKVRVRPLVQSSGVPGVFSVIWAAGTKTGKAFDVQYRVDGGPWIDWKTDTKRLARRFGANDRPVAVEPEHSYEVRARSQKRVDTPTKVSGWSPRALVAEAV